MSIPAFPLLDRTRFIWRQDPNDDSRYVREVAGGEVVEVICNILNHGEQNLFLGVTLTLEIATTAPRFLEHARAAWLVLRSSIPTIASRIAQDVDGSFLLTYRPPSSSEAAREWADRTVILEESKRSLDDLRFEIGQYPIPDPQRDNDQTFLYVIPYSDTSYGLLLYTHHTPFDGVGTKVLMTEYLGILARLIANPSTEALLVPTSWGNEVKHLTPSMDEILGPNQDHDGEGYHKTLGTVMGQLTHYYPRVYGFRERRVGPGPTRRLGYKFSEEVTAALIKRAKELGFNVNQLVHAAMFMVCIKDNPPTAETPKDALIVHNGLVNARKDLAPPYNARLGYSGYCLAMSLISVPVSLFAANLDKGDKEMLLITLQALKDEYTLQKSMTLLPAIVTQEVDLMMQAMKSGPPPPPSPGPWYSGDGIAETWLDAEYCDEEGKRVIKVEDFIQSLNKTDPGPFFRCWTWANRLNLSVDYNEYAMPREDVQEFLNMWADIIQLIL